MRSRSLGALAGVGLFLGAAVAAEAQISVTPTGPTAMYSNDTSEDYTATVTTNYNFTFYLYVMDGTTQVYGNVWHITNQGPSYDFDSGSISTSTWNLAPGENFTYEGRAMLNATRGAVSNLYLTVQNPISMAPGAGARSTDFALAVPPDRRILGLGLADVVEEDLA